MLFVGHFVALQVRPLNNGFRLAHHTTGLTPCGSGGRACAGTQSRTSRPGTARYSCREPPPALLFANRDDHGDRYDAAVLAHLHVGSVDPQIRPAVVAVTSMHAGRARLLLGQRCGLGSAIRHRGQRRRPYVVPLEMLH